MMNIDEIKDKLNSILKEDTSVKILSIILAIIIWFFISINEYPTKNRVFYNVPVQINTDGTFAGENSLKAELAEIATATVYIVGERKQVGNLDAGSLSLNVDISRITSPGEYNLPLEVINNSGKEFQVERIEPENMTVKVERILTREFTVHAVIDSSISVADGYMTKEPIFVSSNTLTVTGPEEQLDSITDVTVTVASAEPITLSSSYEFNSGDISLYNGNVKISTAESSITFNRSNFTVQIPVYVRQSLPLEVSVVNSPEGFDTEYFKSCLEMSASELEIAAPTDKIRDISSINIGTINLREADIGSSFTFNMDTVLPDGYENLSGLSYVTVKCPEEGLAKKVVAIREKNIQIVNSPSQFDFEFITATLMPYFIGPESEIDALTSTDVTCKIDMLSTDFDNREGEIIVPTSFYISKSDKIWINSGTSSLNVYVRAVSKERDRDVRETETE